MRAFRWVPHPVPWLTLIVVTALTIIHLVPTAFELFYFNSVYVEQGQWWRTLTSQLVHLDLTHLNYNIGTLLILGWLLEQGHRRQLLPVLLVGAVAVALYLPASSLWRYCGLSGAISALVPPVVWFLWKEQRSLFPWIIGGLYLGRLLWEWFTGTPLVTDLEWPSHPQAHLMGMAAGTIWLVALRWIRPLNLFTRKTTTRTDS